MWTAYTLYREFAFKDYDTLRKVVLSQLGGGVVESVPETERVRIEVPQELGVEPFIVGPKKDW